MMRRFLAALATTTLLFSMVAVAQPAFAKPSGNGPGNSANAKACQKGGWQNHSRSESPSIAFSNQDECVSYGAKGGTIGPVVIEDTRSITLEWRYSFSGNGIDFFCDATIYLSGFQPGTYTLVRSYGNRIYTVSIDQSGAISVEMTPTGALPTDWAMLEGYSTTWTIDDFSVETVSACR